MKPFHVLVAGVVTVFALAAGPGAAGAAETKKEIDPNADGAVYEWTSKGGIVCHWRAPKKYDAAKGAGLTVICHGTGLDHRWGFAHHDAKTFRPDDFVLVPDGPTRAKDGKTFLFMEADTKKVSDLLDEVKKVVKVRGTYFYGHSQGSFFSMAFAGDFPEQVDGVVAHASGIWAGTAMGPKQHRQAVVLMHGTQDPVVQYSNSAICFQSLVDAKYPMARLRSLEGWNHWPAEHNGDVPHTSQQLAWCEGMTTTDPERMRVCFDTLAEVRGGTETEHDFAGLWSLSNRLASLAAAPQELKDRAAKAKSRVEELAAAHVAALALPQKLVFEKKPWVGHLPVFLRAFQGVPQRDEVAARIEETLATHKKDAVSHLKKYYGALHQNGKQAEAFEEGVAAVAAGFTWCECWDGEVRKNLREWQKDAKKLKLPKGALKTYSEVFEPFEKCLQDGWKDFESVSRKWK